VPPPRAKPEQNDPQPVTPRLEELQARLDELTTEVQDLRDKVSRESTRRRYPFPFGKRSTADQRSRKKPAW
jgi:hypothetical protein